MFAELVKDRQKREQELKKLENMLEKKGGQQQNSTELNNKDTIDGKQHTNKNGDKSEPPPQSWTPMNVDVIDIPFPLDSTTPPKSNNTAPLPPENTPPLNNSIPTIPAPPPKPMLPTTPVPVPPMPNQVVKPPATVPIPATSGTVQNPVPTTSVATKKPFSMDLGKPLVKHKSVTKLPMPPGIKQTDLEVIESPPSRTPTPPSKAKTPPRKSGIMNLPMPPGK